MSGRIGLAVGGRQATAVVLGSDNEVLARAAVSSGDLGADGAIAAAVAALFESLGNAAAPGTVARVVLATALSRPLYRPADCAAVGVLRIGAPAGNAVPPFTRWPTDLTRVVRGRVAMVRGGHEYDGRRSAPVDLAAVQAFGLECRGQVAAVAVTAIHAQANRDDEDQAARVLGDVLGPEVPVITGGQDGGLGLLERENTAVLDAALAPAARRTIDQLAAVMTARGLPDELYLVRGDGTAFPAQAAARRPLRTVGALHSSARSGGAQLAGTSTAVVLDDDGRRMRISAVVGGWPQESGRLVEVLGIRTNLRELRVTDVPERTRAAAIARAAAGLDAPLVLVGDAEQLPDAVLPDSVAGRALRPADGKYAAAIGAAVAEAAGSTDRIFWLGGRSRGEAIAEARLLAEQDAIRAGADPRSLRVPAVQEALMTYVPAPCIRIRVRAVGPILTAARPDGGGL